MNVMNEVVMGRQLCRMVTHMKASMRMENVVEQVFTGVFFC